MTETRFDRNNMTCAEFQDRLPDLFESHADLKSEEHLKTCENCAALVRDLEYIAQQAKLLLPIHDPSPDLWNRIENAMQREPAANTGPSSNIAPIRA
jgi:hypothetical protein